MKLKLFLLPIMFASLMNNAFTQNIGIGTDSPQAKLHVNGNFRLKNGIAVNSISADSTFDVANDSTLPTQKAMKRFMQKGGWLAQDSSSQDIIFQTSKESESQPDFIFAAGKYLYTTTAIQARLSIFDISNPQDIILKGVANTNTDGPQGVYVLGKYAYVINSPITNTLCIFDISDPENIVAKGVINLPASGAAIFVQGNYAYAACNSGLFIYDVSNPDNIVAKGSLSLALAAASIFVQGDFAYLPTSSSGTALSVFDISNPNTIIAKGSAPLPIGSNILFLKVRDKYAYLATRSGLFTFDVSNPSNVIQTGSISISQPFPTSVCLQRNYLYYVSAPGNVLSVFDISDPHNILPRATTSIGLDQPYRVAAQGNSIFVWNYLSSAISSFYYRNSTMLEINESGGISLGLPQWDETGDNLFKLNGNVGIGTVAPGDRLSVSNGITMDVDGLNDGNLLNSIKLGGYNAGEGIASKRTPNGNVNGLDLYTGGNNRLAITNAGNVGVGTIGPLNKLDVMGSAVIGSTYSGNNTAPANGLLIEGNVGIGNTSPTQKLSVSGSVTIDKNGTNTGTINNAIIFGGDAETQGIGSKKTAGGNQNGLDFYTNNSNRMVITNSGRIGIGTTSPSVALEVVGSVPYNTGAYRYLNLAGTGTLTSSNVNVSIRASSVIVATEFEANSDIRIKRNINTSSSEHDLSTLLKIRVADYQFQDSLYQGSRRIKGFIAQELETVMPQSVHTSGDYVPDIYSVSATTEYNEKNKTLTISLCKPHQLRVGDKIKIFAGDGMQEQYVSAIANETSFTLGNWEIKEAGMNPTSKVFVWGKWVNDFHTVDYNQVFSLGISAIQQLAKENDELKKETEMLKNKTESLQQQINELKKVLLKSK